MHGERGFSLHVDLLALRRFSASDQNVSIMAKFVNKIVY